MKVGLDGFALHPLKLDPFGQFDYCSRNGFDGILLSGVRSLSADLKHEDLTRIHSRADELGLYCHVSVYPVNPVPSSRSVPDVAQDLTSQIQVAARCGWHELHSSLGAEKERYELPTPWAEQVDISTEVLKAVAPVLSDCGSRLNLENHGDATTFELVRIAEEVGPDAIGICLDTANLLVFAENPDDAIRRAAPYVHMTHAKDAFVYFCESGLMRQGRAVGQGCIDWRKALTTLAEYAPNLHLSIEDHKWLFYAHIFRDDWMREQQDLTRDELARTVALAWDAQQKRNAGDLSDPVFDEQTEYADEMDQRLQFGRDHLNALLDELNLRS